MTSTRRRARRSLCVTLALLLALVAVGPAGAAASADRGATAAAAAATAPDPAQLRQAVANATGEAKRAARALGVHVVRVDDGVEIYDLAADTQRIIASNTKLPTAAAALVRLGPDFAFDTPLLVRGELDRASRTLRGDVAILGRGDPTFSGRFHDGDSYARFRPWAQRLRRLGVDRVEGRVVLVTGYFSDGIIHPDWPRDQLDRWYEAPVSALSFNDNCILVQVRPGGSQAGATVRGTSVPHLPERFPVTGGVEVTNSSRRHAVMIARSGPRVGANTPLRVGGRIYRKRALVDRWVAVYDPVDYFDAALRAAFAEEGVTLTDAVTETRATLPPAPAALPWRQLTSARTELLPVLAVVNKRSQNFFAEMVLKTLGAEVAGDGSWEGGLGVVRDALTELGVPARTYRLADGSGMSRNNTMSPRGLTALLGAMHHHPTGPAFASTLPYGGEEDLPRWSKRLAAPPYRGNALAKTGSLRAVSTLSGYARGRSGTLYAFSILGNQVRGGGAMRRGQDAIVRALIDHG
ncbi:MAG: D-alanyl-D-alanine carboxypeptidase/D-alanyl-D-alanine-endopeptidase [Acidobacteriota bacterium]